MWEQIRSNQIRSIVLVTGLGVLLLAVGYFLGVAFLGSPVGGLAIAFILWAILNLVAYFQGDSILLSVASARRIGPDDHPRLYNVVEEMKIASGLEKMPAVYIIDDPALNAFATGRSPERASMAITSGLLQKLNRDELQGVIAHEMSHVKNRDALLMMMSGILLGTIVILAWYASRMLLFSGAARGGRRGSRSGGGGGGGGGAQVVIMVAGLLLMILAPIMAELLYFALSRRREYLADASAALYTRYPEGLASALEKLAGSTSELKSANKATAPMYIINPFRGRGQAATSLTSTHPPIAERIKILRSMGGASLADYDAAFREVRGKGVMPASVLAGAPSLAARAALPAEEEPAPAERARQTSDALWRGSDFTLIECDCGTRLRVPPDYDEDSIRCPHCGRVHALAS